MSKPKTQRKKKRKREKSSESLLTAEDRQLDRTEVQAGDLREGIDADSNCAERAKKKKKRRKNSANKGEKTLGKRDSIGTKSNSIDVSLTHAGVQEQKEDTTKNSIVSSERLLKKSKKKKKKRNPSGDSLDKIRNDDENTVDKVGSHGGEMAENDTGNETVLEGSMVMDVLVLIDRASAKVFSATEELLENGDRKQIGRLDGNGEVVLFQNTEEKQEKGEI